MGNSHPFRVEIEGLELACLQDSSYKRSASARRCDGDAVTDVKQHDKENAGGDFSAGWR